ncbi:MAG: biopolymer transporter ExbD [Burkholderiales bacterium]|nr:biopolymer transporter ExbD [Burkholderiales bacterium]
MAFGRLERTAGPQPMSDINMTPLIDVMLVLVVIFILTAPLLASSLRLDLPKAEAARPQEAPQVVQVALDQAGQVYLQDQPLALEALQLRLADIARQNAQAEVQLRADETVPYGRVVAVLDAAHKAGLSRIGFVAKP